MKRKLLTVFLTLIAALCLCFALVACNDKSDSGNQNTDNGAETDLWTVERLYAEAQAKGFEGSLDDLIALFKGDKGDDGDQGPKGDKGDTGAQGPKGDKGDTGAQGPKGDKGDTGDQGPKGDKGDTGAQGPKGDDGQNGVGILSVEIDENGHLKVTLTDGTVLDAGKVTPDGTAADETTETLQFQTIRDTNGYSVEVVGLGPTWDPNIVIPSTYHGLKVTSIADYAFDAAKDARNADLTSIEIPDSVISIGKDAFSGCESLTKIHLPNNLYTIGKNAFNDCIGLTEIKIPDSVQTIESGTFSYCISLTRLTIGHGVRSIGNEAFFNCIHLIEVWNYSNLQLTVGEDVVNGMVAFYAKRVYTTNEASKQTITEDGFFFLEDETDAYLFGYQGNETNLTFPSKSPKGKDYKINLCAFSTCHTLESITIPESVTVIEWGAFNGCDSLTSVAFEGNSQVNMLDFNVFGFCKQLTRVEIPKSVTVIIDSAFLECGGLTDIQYKGTIKEWQEIEIGPTWDIFIGDYIVTCSDGTIDKAGNVTYFEQ